MSPTTSKEIEESIKYLYVTRRTRSLMVDNKEHQLVQ
jgi:hypothetical protein